MANNHGLLGQPLFGSAGETFIHGMMIRARVDVFTQQEALPSGLGYFKLRAQIFMKPGCEESCPSHENR
jgi:hypothetical protein